MSHEIDPPEYIGREAGVRADPAGHPQVKPLAPAPVAAPKIEGAPLELFDSMGRIVAPDADAMGRMKKEQPEMFTAVMRVLSANVAAVDAEAHHDSSTRALYSAVASEHKARAEVVRLTAQVTHTDALRAKIFAEKHGHSQPSPEPSAEALAAAVAADEAEADLTKLKIALEHIRGVLRTKRGELSEAIQSWQKLQPQRDVADLMRAGAAKERQAKLDRIAKGLPAVEVQAAPAHQFEIDRVLSAKRQRGRPMFKPVV